MLNYTVATGGLIAAALTTSSTFSTSSTSPTSTPAPYIDPTTLLSTPSTLLATPSTYPALSASLDELNTTAPNSNTDTTPHETFLTISRYVVQRIFVPVVLVLGVLGNTITIVVLTRRQMRSSTNNYLTALAISDLLYLVFTFTLSLRHHPGMDKPHHWFYWHYFRYALWLTDASSSTSIWLTVTFTIERYIAVCHPIKGKVFCTESRAKRVIVAVFVLCFTLTASTPHEWVIKETTDEETGHPFLFLDYSNLGSNSTYRTVFYWFTAVIFILLPLLLLAVFNSILIHVVKQSRAQRNTMTSQRPERDSHSQSQENKITIMLIAVVLLALLCQLPVAGLLLYQSFVHVQPNTKAYYINLGLGNIFNLLSAINAACNFVLYCAMSDKYRRTFLRTFCSRWYRHPSPMHSWMATAYSNVEDGSPRFSRVSSMRMSRRSSYRQPRQTAAAVADKTAATTGAAVTVTTDSTANHPLLKPPRSSTASPLPPPPPYKPPTSSSPPSPPPVASPVVSSNSYHDARPPPPQPQLLQPPQAHDFLANTSL